MEKKRLFQVLDEMNVYDAEHKTHLVAVCPDVISIDHIKRGTKVTIGAPVGLINISHNLKGSQRIVMLVIDGAEYDKRSKEG